MTTHLLPIVCLVFVFCAQLKAGDNEFYQEVRNSRNFTGKVVLITGSDSGIGKQTAKLFAALGANVVVTGRKSDQVQKAVEEVQSASPKGLKPLGVAADLTKVDDVEHLFNSTIRQFGKLDVLVNDAGSYFMAYLSDPDFMNILDKNLAIDVKPALELIRQAIPFLKASKGTIINISSILTKRPRPGFLTYVIAKDAIKRIAEVATQELSPFGIRVNTISPGAIDSHGSTNDSAKIAAVTPLRRTGVPEDIAKGIVFLASTDAEYITGVNLVIDGGLSFGGNSV